VRLHVGGGRCSVGDTDQLDVGHWVPLRARHVDENLLLRHDKGGVRGRGAGAVVDEVEVRCLLVEEKLSLHAARQQRAAASRHCTEQVVCGKADACCEVLFLYLHEQSGYAQES
jgi:hypothetical protein